VLNFKEKRIIANFYVDEEILDLFVVNVIKTSLKVQFFYNLF